MGGEEDGRRGRWEERKMGGEEDGRRGRWEERKMGGEGEVKRERERKNNNLMITVTAQEESSKVKGLVHTFSPSSFLENTVHMSEQPGSSNVVTT